MEGAEEELERRSKFLKDLIMAQKLKKKKKTAHDDEEEKMKNFVVRVRAADMPFSLQDHAFNITTTFLCSISVPVPRNVHNKTLALQLKKEFDSAYGPAWHCVVGTSFGSFVTYSLGVSSISQLITSMCFSSRLRSSPHDV